MKWNKKELLRPAAVLAIICLVVTSALALTDAITKDAIANLAAQKEQASQKLVLPDAVLFEEVEGQPGVCKALDQNGNCIGYTMVTSANGYGGAVKVMTGISLSRAVTSIIILEHSETVGLGAKCETESFRDLFVGIPPADGFHVNRPGKAPTDGGIEALTSATITSNAVVTAVNQALALFDSLEKGED